MISTRQETLRSTVSKKSGELICPSSRRDRINRVNIIDSPSRIISVAAGQDVTRKIISFAQQRLEAICILSANGAVSNVMLSQPDSFGGKMTYEGPFELLSLSGSFMSTGRGGSGDRSGGMRVALAASKGRVIGGRIGGFLVAATPVQVIVGSFLPSYQTEQKSKKPRYGTSLFPMPATSSAPQPNIGPFRAFYSRK